MAARFHFGRRQGDDPVDAFIACPTQAQVGSPLRAGAGGLFERPELDPRN